MEIETCFFLKLSGHVTSADCYGEQEPKLSIVSRENKPFEVIKLRNDSVHDGNDYKDAIKKDDDDDNDDEEDSVTMGFFSCHVDHP